MDKLQQVAKMLTDAKLSTEMTQCLILQPLGLYGYVPAHLHDASSAHTVLFSSLGGKLHPY